MRSQCAYFSIEKVAKTDVTLPPLLSLQFNCFSLRNVEDTLFYNLLTPSFQRLGGTEELHQHLGESGWSPKVLNDQYLFSPFPPCFIFKYVLIGN